MRKKRSDRAKALIREAARIRERVEKAREEKALKDDLDAFMAATGGEPCPDPKKSRVLIDGLDFMARLVKKQLAADSKRRLRGRGGRIDVVYGEDNVPLHQDERW